MEDGVATEPEVVACPADARVAFEAFFRGEIEGVLALVLVTTRNRGASEEIAQEAFLRAWNRWAVVGEHERPDAWVRRVALNLATSRFRRLRVERLALSRLADREIGVEDRFGDDELWQAVRGLSARQRQVVALTYVEGRTAEDIGQILGIAAGTVRVHLTRARTTLRDELEASP